MSTFDFTQAHRWGGRPVAVTVRDAEPRGRVVVTGTILDLDVVDRGGVASLLGRLDDGTGQIDLLFLGRVDVAGLGKGIRCTVEGTARMGGGRLVIWNPLYRLEPPDEPG